MATLVNTDGAFSGCHLLRPCPAPWCSPGAVLSLLPHCSLVLPRASSMLPLAEQIELQEGG